MRSLMLSLSLLSLPLLGGLRAPERLGSLAVANMPQGFAVIKDGKVNIIEPDCVDSMLRKMDFKQRNAYLLNGGSLEINQANTGEYTLKTVANLKGGGVIGAWIGSAIGYGVVTGIGHGTIQLIAVATGPFYTATAGALHKMLAIPIHKAACATGIAIGVAAGVATGPV